MELRVASIFVRRGRAYLPVMAQTEIGVFIGVEPVCTTALVSEDLVGVLNKILATEHPQIPHPTQAEWRRLSRKDPVLRAARVKDWKEFSQHSAVYNIEWAEQVVTVYILELDHQGQAEYASAEKMSFAKDASLQTIVEAILDDVRSRPELLVIDSG